MKNITRLLLLTTHLTSLNLQARESSYTKIKGMGLQSCTQTKKCLELKTNFSESGNFTDIMAFQEFHLKLTSTKGARTLVGDFGYLDTQNDKLVVTLKNKTELEISLKDLSEHSFN